LTFIFLECISFTMGDFLKKLDSAVTEDTVGFETLFIKIESLINTIKQDMIVAFQNKQNTFAAVSMRDERKYEFYESFYIKSKNRIDALKIVLDSLLKTVKIYIKTPDNKKNENIFLPIKEYYSDLLKNVHFLADLLLEDDVSKVIVENYLITYPNSNKRDITDYIIENHRKFKKMAPDLNNPNPENYKETINALMYLTLFWFKVKGENEKNIRKSDKYIYQLCRICLL